MKKLLGGTNWSFEPDPSRLIKQKGSRVQDLRATAHSSDSTQSIIKELTVFKK
jgi:hypothetical protein